MATENDMSKKVKKTMAKSVDINHEAEQAEENILNQAGEQTDGKRHPRFRKPADTVEFQRELSTEYIRSMGRYIT